jgi:hypothetical protein
MVTVKHLTDYSQLVRVLSHPKVSSYALPDYVTDIDVVAAATLGGIVLAVEEEGRLAGVFSFAEINPAVYEIHTSLLPECKDKLGAAREAVLWLFANTRALRVITRVPVFNRAAKRFALAAGMHMEYTKEEAFLWRGEWHDVEFMGLGIHSWVWHHAEHFDTYGAVFHSQIHKVNALHGLPDHPDEPCHDAMVGAALRLHCAGNTQRGIALYNEWAAVSGYAPAKLVSDHDSYVVLSMGALEVRLDRDGRVSSCL